MSVLELQPQYELQLYKLLLGAAALAGGEVGRVGSRTGGSMGGAGQLRICTPSEQIYFNKLCSQLSPISPPQLLLLSLVFVSCLKYSLIPPEGCQMRCEGETELCYHTA